MIYFDSSYILKCYLNEPHAERVRALAGQVAGKYCCHWGRVEVFSGLKRHLRENKLTDEQAKEILRLFESDEQTGVWTWLPMERAFLNSTCSAIDKIPPSLFLRSGDAIHLSCARENGFKEIYSSDKHLLAAASSFGLIGKNILSTP